MGQISGGVEHFVRCWKKMRFSLRNQTLASAVFAKQILFLSTKSATAGASKKESEVNLVDEVVGLCKRRGFIFRNSEIYGGMAGQFDYGPLGSQMKKNIKDLWWREFVTSRGDCVGFDSPILLNTNVWRASGHTENFSDELVVCNKCGYKHRKDKMVDNKCEGCKSTDLSEPRNFNLLFKTNWGPVEDADSAVYLRPETAQGIFIAFKNIHSTTRRNLPFGVGQMGRSFRNEISPREFLFRTREFEQAELEFFCAPDEAMQWYRHWVDYAWSFLLKYGLSEKNLRKEEFGAGQGAHYAQATTDIEYKFPFGWGEIWGIANRGNYDLSVHSKNSGQTCTVPIKNAKGETEQVVPYVVEPALGVDRLFFALLCDAFAKEDLGEGDSRVVMRFHELVAPIRFAVLPLRSNVPGMDEMVEDVAKILRQLGPTAVDVTGSIGKRYRRQDEIGTPWCFTVDFESLTTRTVTRRDRDSMQQTRVSIDDLAKLITSSSL